MSIWHLSHFFKWIHHTWSGDVLQKQLRLNSFQSFSWGSPELSPHDFKQKCVSTNVSTVFPNWSSMLPCIYVNLSLLYLLENDPLYPDPTSNILVFPLVHPSIGDRAAISSMKWASPGHNRSIFFNRSEGLLCGKKPHNSSQGGAGSNRHVYLQNLTAWWRSNYQVASQLEKTCSFSNDGASTRLPGITPLPWSWSWTIELSQNPLPQVITLS